MQVTLFIRTIHGEQVEPSAPPPDPLHPDYEWECPACEVVIVAHDAEGRSRLELHIDEYVAAGAAMNIGDPITIQTGS